MIPPPHASRTVRRFHPRRLPKTIPPTQIAQNNVSSALTLPLSPRTLPILCNDYHHLALQSSGPRGLIGKLPGAHAPPLRPQHSPPRRVRPLKGCSRRSVAALRLQLGTLGLRARVRISVATQEPGRGLQRLLCSGVPPHQHSAGLRAGFLRTQERKHVET